MCVGGGGRGRGRLYRNGGCFGDIEVGVLVYCFGGVGGANMDVELQT